MKIGVDKQPLVCYNECVKRGTQQNHSQRPGDMTETLRIGIQTPDIVVVAERYNQL